MKIPSDWRSSGEQTHIDSHRDHKRVEKKLSPYKRKSCWGGTEAQGGGGEVQSTGKPFPLSSRAPRDITYASYTWFLGSSCMLSFAFQVEKASMVVTTEETSKKEYSEESFPWKSFLLILKQIPPSLPLSDANGVYLRWLCTTDQPPWKPPQWSAKRLPWNN